MMRRRKAKEEELRKADEEKAREDPTYRPHFKPIPDLPSVEDQKAHLKALPLEKQLPEMGKPTAPPRGTTPAERKAFDDKVLRKRLHEERRKHFPEMQRKFKERYEM